MPPAAAGSGDRRGASRRALNIVFVSHTAFHPDMVIGSHQLAREYGRQGHRVLHVSLPFSALHLTRLGKPRMAHRLRHALRGVRPVAPGLFEWIPLTLLPWDAVKRLLPLFGRNLSLPLRWRVRRALRAAGIEAVDLALVDEPRMSGIETALRAKRLVYRATDLYAEMRGDPLITYAEREQLAVAQLAVGTSEDVATHLRSLRPSADVQVFRNGFDARHFASRQSPHPTLRERSRPRAVYVGAIDFRFDLDAVVELAHQRPELTVMLYGPVTIDLPPDLPPNLCLEGSLPYASLPAVLPHCEVALMPFLDIKANRARSPMKFYEYLAAGNAVAAFATETLTTLAVGEPVFLYHPLEGVSLSGAVDRALGATPPHRDEHSATMQAHSWEATARRLLERALDAPSLPPATVLDDALEAERA